MAVQTSYSENIAAGVAGHVPDMRNATIISRDVEPVGGMAFGVAAFQGTADKQITTKAAGAAESASEFVGVTVLDRSVRSGNAYAQRESARVITQGPVMVTAGAAVAAGDQVAVTSAGAWSNVAGANGVVIAGARWDTSAANGALAVIVLK